MQINQPVSETLKMIADLEIEAMIADLDKEVDLEVVWKPTMKNTLFSYIFYYIFHTNVYKDVIDNKLHFCQFFKKIF